jgi:hypothetical protein
MPRHTVFKCFALATVLTLSAAPLVASFAEAASRKKSNGMMRLGGPSQNGNLMRLGGPSQSRSADGGIYTIPNRFASNRSEDVRQYFLRRDQQGSGN